jgi:hypothetical protein
MTDDELRMRKRYEAFNRDADPRGLTAQMPVTFDTEGLAAAATRNLGTAATNFAKAYADKRAEVASRVQALADAAAKHQAEMELQKQKDSADAEARRQQQEADANRQYELEKMRIKADEPLKTAQAKFANERSRSSGTTFINPNEKLNWTQEEAALSQMSDAMDKSIGNYFPVTTSAGLADETKPFDAALNPIVRKEVRRGIADLDPVAQKFFGDAKPYVLMARARRMSLADARAKIDELKSGAVGVGWLASSGDDMNAAYNVLVGTLSPNATPPPPPPSGGVPAPQTQEEIDYYNSLKK